MTGFAALPFKGRAIAYARGTFARRLCAAALLLAAVAPAMAQTVWTQRSPGSIPGGRIGATMTYDAGNGYALLFGGAVGPITWGDTWSWDGATWKFHGPATSPPSRVDTALAYDAAHGYVLLFGGAGSASHLNDTWTWDGGTWTQQTLASSPAARHGAAMVYDDAHHQVVLFGGMGGGGHYLNDTWTWDGSTWTQQNPASSPPARYYATMVYDAARGQVLLFGGLGADALNDTWTWNGGTWTQQNPASSPPARYRAMMAYDAASGLVALFGGIDGGSNLNDTWAWNGSTWTQRSPAGSPPARQGAAMAYDAAHQQVVLFAGGYLDDTWTLEMDVTLSASVDSLSIVQGQSPTTLTAILAYDGAAPAGSVVFSVNGSAVGSTDTSACAASSGAMTCTYSYATSALAAGSYTVAAGITDSNGIYGAASSDPEHNGTLTVTAAPPPGAPIPAPALTPWLLVPLAGLLVALAYRARRGVVGKSMIGMLPFSLRLAAATLALGTALGLPGASAQARNKSAHLESLSTCVVGATGCGWHTGDLVTHASVTWGDTGVVPDLFKSTYDSLYLFLSDLLTVGSNPGYTLTFTSPEAVIAYLPSSGAPGPLTVSLLDPTSSASGSLGGEVVALNINLMYTDANQLGAATGVSFGDLHVCGLTDTTSAFNGNTIRQVYDVANSILGGASSSITPFDLYVTLSGINFGFESGNVSTFAQAHLVNGACP
jgi:hypothetical protein